MLSSITDVARVRKLGGLLADENAGAPTAGQIEAAIAVAQQRMIKTIGFVSYKATKELTEEAKTEDDELAKQFEAYRTAESYFSLAVMPWIARNQQQGANGTTSSVQVGQGTTSFAGTSENEVTEKKWTDLALEVLASYLESDDEDIISSDDESFQFAAI